MQKTVTTLTLHDLQFLKDVVVAIRNIEDGYITTPDPLYNLGKTRGPKAFDKAYRDAIERGFTSQTAYLVDLLEGMPDLYTYSSYIYDDVMTAIGEPDSNLTTAFFDGAWVATMVEYVNMICPCVYQKSVTYIGGPRPETPPPVVTPDPEYGSLYMFLDIRFDNANYMLKGTLNYHHVDGPLPYFDDFIGGLYQEKDTSVIYSLGDFLLEAAEFCHGKRVRDWRLDETVVIDPYMTQFGVYLKDDSNVAYNTPGILSSAIWLNDWNEHNGKVHSPTCIPFEDWFVFFNMIPHSDLATIKARAASTLDVTASGIEYIWYPPAATPWIP